MDIGYLGPAGSYTNTAALNVFSQMAIQINYVPKSTITDLVVALVNNELDQSITPVENSIAGGVAESIDALLKSEGVYINKEYVMSINHCLLAKRFSQSGGDLTHIHAHPMSFAQCSKLLRANYPNAHLMSCPSNSFAAEWIANLPKPLSEKSKKSNHESREHHAAIASELCAELYGLEILAKGINDENNNQTRFWVLSKTLSSPTGKDKSTIVFQTKDEPGSLVKVLGCFAELNINLSRIESRPASKLGEYAFCLDFNVHKDDEKFEQLMKKIQPHFTYYKWLGSYS